MRLETDRLLPLVSRRSPVDWSESVTSSLAVLLLTLDIAETPLRSPRAMAVQRGEEDRRPDNVQENSRPSGDVDVAFVRPWPLLRTA